MSVTKGVDTSGDPCRKHILILLVLRIGKSKTKCTSSDNPTLLIRWRFKSFAPLLINSWILALSLPQKEYAVLDKELLPTNWNSKEIPNGELTK